MKHRQVLSPLLLSTLALAACKTVANDGRDRTPTSASASGGAIVPAAGGVAVVDAAAPSAPETPLAWGTRPSATGPLFPVVDGMCIHGEIWPLKSGGALYTYGNGNGPWSRGTETTYARLVDDGIDTSGAVGVAAPGPTQELRDGLRTLATANVTGSWPGSVIAYGEEQGYGRMREYPSLWSHGDAGWTPLVSWKEERTAEIGSPVLFRGNAVTWLHLYKEGSSDSTDDRPIFKAFPLEKGVTPLNLSALSVRDQYVQSLASDDTSLYVFGTRHVTADKLEAVLGVWTDGKVKRIAAPDVAVFAGTRPAVVMYGDGGVFRLDGDKFVRMPFTLPKDVKMSAVAEAPNGDVWILPTTRKSVLVVHRDGQPVQELPLTAPKAPGAHENVQHWPSSGGPLAGVEVDDPWVIGEAGSLYHLEGGAFREVEMPVPPFAASGHYQAQALLVPAKGDAYVNAGYAEKGVGWKTVERYRAVLRTKRPHEVLRCTEPGGGSVWGSGRGFLSAPPIATDACTTPFVILLRVAYGVGTKEEAWSYDRKTDYPSVREAIKATPSLGAAVDLVEVVSGSQRFLGATAPTVAAGKELALAVAKRVQNVSETRPEVVCATPTAARTLHVDVATGKVKAP